LLEQLLLRIGFQFGVERGQVFYSAAQDAVIDLKTIEALDCVGLAARLYEIQVDEYLVICLGLDPVYKLRVLPPAKVLNHVVAPVLA
jgi:hypothetical protein